MKLSEQLEQDHNSGEFGSALEGYSARARETERLLTRCLQAIAALVESHNDWPMNVSEENEELISGLYRRARYKTDNRGIAYE